MTGGIPIRSHDFAMPFERVRSSKTAARIEPATGATHRRARIKCGPFRQSLSACYLLARRGVSVVDVGKLIPCNSPQLPETAQKHRKTLPAKTIMWRLCADRGRQPCSRRTVALTSLRSVARRLRIGTSIGPLPKPYHNWDAGVPPAIAIIVATANQRGGDAAYSSLFEIIDDNAREYPAF